MILSIAVSFLTLLLAALPAADAPKTPVALDDSKAPKSVTCAFSNIRYSGWCRATQDIPEGSNADEVCQKVLNCLNDTSCTKTYCNATEIRGGWKLEEVQTDK